MRAQLEDEVLPSALALGVSYELFWSLNPRKLNVFAKAHNIKQREIDFNNWYLGQYIMSAIACCFDKKSKYPPKPLLDEYYEIANMPQEEYDRRQLQKMLFAEEQWNKQFEKKGLQKPTLD